MGPQGDPHKHGDYDPCPNYHRYDREAPPCAPPRVDYVPHYDREYDRRHHPSPPCCHHDDYDLHDQHDDPNRRREVHRARIQKSVRVEVPKTSLIVIFDSSCEPKNFIDWESNMNSYFHWYCIDIDICIEYAEMRLGRQAKIFCENEYFAAERRGLPITTWTEMV